MWITGLSDYLAFAIFTLQRLTWMDHSDKPWFIHQNTTSKEKKTGKTEEERRCGVSLRVWKLLGWSEIISAPLESNNAERKLSCGEAGCWGGHRGQHLSGPELVTLSKQFQKQLKSGLMNDKSGGKERVKKDDIVPGTSPTACVRIQKGFLHMNMWLLSLDKSKTHTDTHTWTGFSYFYSQSSNTNWCDWQVSQQAALGWTLAVC